MRKQRNEGKLELTLIDTSFLDISNRSLLNNVPHQEPLDGLVLFHHQHEIKTNQSHIYKMHIRTDTQTCMYVCMYVYAYLRAALAAVRAADELDVSTAVLVATTIPALESLQREQKNDN